MIKLLTFPFKMLLWIISTFIFTPLIAVFNLSSKKGKVSQYRNLVNPLGFPEIEGIESISDDRIIEIYNEVETLLSTIAGDRKELGTLTYQAIDCLVRDCLIDEINGVYPDKLSNIEQQYRAAGLNSLFIKGRSYTCLT